MAKQTSIFAIAGSRVALQTFIGSDGTTIKDIVTAGANDSIIRSINLSSQDTTVQTFQLFLNNGTVGILLATFDVAPQAGATAAQAPSDALAIASLPRDARGNKLILLPAGSKLQMRALAAVGGTIGVAVQAEDY